MDPIYLAWFFSKGAKKVILLLLSFFVSSVPGWVERGRLKAILSTSLSGSQSVRRYGFIAKPSLISAIGDCPSTSIRMRHDFFSSSYAWTEPRTRLSFRPYASQSREKNSSFGQSPIARVGFIVLCSQLGKEISMDSPIPEKKEYALFRF